MGLFASLIGLVFSILSLVYLFKIRSDTNDNIFKQPIVPSIKEKFFYSTNTTPAVNPADISIKCELYQESIMNPKVTMLGDVFNLNIDNIHSKANLLLLFDNIYYHIYFDKDRIKFGFMFNLFCFFGKFRLMYY